VGWLVEEGEEVLDCGQKRIGGGGMVGGGTSSSFHQRRHPSSIHCETMDSSPINFPLCLLRTSRLDSTGSLKDSGHGVVSKGEVVGDCSRTPGRIRTSFQIKPKLLMVLWKRQSQILLKIFRLLLRKVWRVRPKTVICMLFALSVGK